MDALDREIAACESAREPLERDHFGRWVLFRDESLAGDFASYGAAITEAMRRFGRGPYLIRQVGAPPLRLPASATCETSHVGA